MGRKIAIDFGTSNTVVAYWDEASQKGRALEIPHISRPGTYYSQKNQKELTWFVPSLIHYSDNNNYYLGNQVIERNLCSRQGTFRWMKRYISNRNPSKIEAAGRQISHFEAANDFISQVFAISEKEMQSPIEQVVFTIPVESFEHYEKWVSDVAENSQISRYRFIDEPTAAALGYGAKIEPNDVYLVFDFGGGTLDVSVVLIEDGINSTDSRRCRVLGKAGEELGGMNIDSWIFQEVLKRNGFNEKDENVRNISNALLRECEKAKKRLSSYEKADITMMVPDQDIFISTTLSRSDFENEILDTNEFFKRINSTILSALMKSGEKGYVENNIKSVLMVGGSSLIPCVQRTVLQIFGRDKVLLDRPLDTVACGAATFAAGVDLYDYVQHEYAIRHVDVMKNDYVYRTIIDKGTHYPTSKPVTLRIKSTYDGQKHFGLAIYEISNNNENLELKELVFDHSGVPRIVEVDPEIEKKKRFFWMNEDSPTFLIADPPAEDGKPRFEIEFKVDENKRLLLSAKDLISNKVIKKDFPVIKLT